MSCSTTTKSDTQLSATITTAKVYKWYIKYYMERPFLFSFAYILSSTKTFTSTSKQLCVFTDPIISQLSFSGLKYLETLDDYEIYFAIIGTIFKPSDPADPCTGFVFQKFSYTFHLSLDQIV